MPLPLASAGGTRRRQDQMTKSTEIARRTRGRGTRELRPSSPPNTPAGPQGRPRMATRTPEHQVRRMRFLGVRFPSPQEFNLGMTPESAIPRLPRVVAVLGSASRATYAPRLLAKPGRSPPSPGCLCSPSAWRNLGSAGRQGWTITTHDAGGGLSGSARPSGPSLRYATTQARRT